MVSFNTYGTSTFYCLGVVFKIHHVIWLQVKMLKHFLEVFWVRLFGIMLKCKNLIGHFVQSKFFELFIIGSGENYFLIRELLKHLIHLFKNSESTILGPYYKGIYRINKDCFHILAIGAIGTLERVLLMSHFRKQIFEKYLR